MEITNEIQSAVKNIKYYSQRIEELAKKQLEIDLEERLEIELNLDSESTRLNSLGAIGLACDWLNIYCENIESHLETAIEQDKLLYDKK